MNHDRREEAEQEIEPEIAESAPCVNRPNDAIAVPIPIHAMLLHDGLKGRGRRDRKMWLDGESTDVVRVLFGVAGTPFGVFSARGDRRAGKVWTLYNLVGVDLILTPSRHWSLWGFQSVSGLEWHVVHVVPPDRIDERKERNREKG